MIYHNLLSNLQVGSMTSIYRRLQKLATSNTSWDRGNLRKKAQHLPGPDVILQWDFEWALGIIYIFTKCEKNASIALIPKKIEAIDNIIVL